MRIRSTIILSLLAATAFMQLSFAGNENSGSIGQPTIFWRNCQWETFQDGKWISWAQTCNRNREIKSQAADGSGLGQPNVGIGKANTQIGRPNVELGQRTIGIGRNKIGRASCRER